MFHSVASLKFFPFLFSVFLGSLFKFSLPYFLVLCFLYGFAVYDVNSFIENFVIELCNKGKVIDALVKFKACVETNITFAILALLLSVW